MTKACHIPECWRNPPCHMPATYLNVAKPSNVNMRVAKLRQCAPLVASPCLLNNAGPNSSSGTRTTPLLILSTLMASSFTRDPWPEAGDPAVGDTWLEASDPAVGGAAMKGERRAPHTRSRAQVSAPLRPIASAQMTASYRVVCSARSQRRKITSSNSNASTNSRPPSCKVTTNLPPPSVVLQISCNVCQDCGGGGGGQNLSQDCGACACARKHVLEHGVVPESMR